MESNCASLGTVESVLVPERPRWLKTVTAQAAEAAAKRSLARHVDTLTDVRKQKAEKRALQGQLDRTRLVLGRTRHKLTATLNHPPAMHKTAGVTKERRRHRMLLVSIAKDREIKQQEEVELVMERVESDGGINVKLADQVVGERWAKSLWNTPFNPLSVLADGADTVTMLDTPGGESASLWSAEPGLPSATPQEEP